ncbi:hypothetical protein WJX79_002380 [Trebouxia sp. C0005]
MRPRLCVSVLHLGKPAPGHGRTGKDITIGWISNTQAQHAVVKNVSSCSVHLMLLKPDWRYHNRTLCSNHCDSAKGHIVQQPLGHVSLEAR